MKSLSVLILILTFLFTGVSNNNCSAQLPQEKPLWPGGIPANPVKYKEEKIRTSEPAMSSLSHLNRVFSYVSVPTYIIHKPEKNKVNGVAIVICPGGGFRDVWFDREGNDLALWLSERGVTSLVLKYRTYNSDAEGFNLDRNIYDQQVYADARQAIYTLRSMAKELNIDKNKVGIGGFSAGGSLSLTAALDMYEKELPAYVKFNHGDGKPNFAGLFYPGLSPKQMDVAKNMDSIPPVFIMNGGEDKTTPAINCIELYKLLTSRQIKTELHIYAKGGHGFDSGVGRGNGISMWRESFISWLKDSGFITEK